MADESKVKNLDCYLKGVSCEGVSRTITATERGLKDRTAAPRADAFEGSAVRLADRTDGRKR